jgi:serine/threonine protein kinase
VAVKVLGDLNDAQAAHLMRTVATLMATTRGCAHVVPYLAAQRAPPAGLHIVKQLFRTSLEQVLLQPGSSSGQVGGRAVAVCRLEGSAVVEPGRGLPVQQALQVAADVLAGLAQLHARGVAAGALRPGNVLLDDSGVAHVADYGLPLRPSVPQGALTSRTVADSSRYV